MFGTDAAFGCGCGPVAHAGYPGDSRPGSGLGAAPGGLDATPLYFCAASPGPGACPRRLPLDGRIQPVGADPCGGGGRGTGRPAFRVPLTVAATRHTTWDAGAGGQAAAAAARGAEVLPGPGERPVRLQHPRGRLGVPGNPGPAPTECGDCRDAAGPGQPAAAQGTGSPRGPYADRGQPE